MTARDYGIALYVLVPLALMGLGLMAYVIVAVGDPAPVAFVAGWAALPVIAACIAWYARREARDEALAVELAEANDREDQIGT